MKKFIFANWKALGLLIGGVLLGILFSVLITGKANYPLRVRYLVPSQDAESGAGSLPGSETAHINSNYVRNEGMGSGLYKLASKSPMEASYASVAAPKKLPVRQMIVFNRSITLKVSAIRKTAGQIEKLVESVGGFVASMSFGDSGVQLPLSQEGSVDNKATSFNVKDGNLVVRIPARYYKSFVARAKSLGELIDESETADEVTQQHVDLAARLRNLIREENRMVEIFNQAGNVSEMLLVENQLNRIRGEIESLTAQKKTLENSVALATVTIVLRRTPSLVEPEKADWGFDVAMRQAVMNFIGVVKGIIVFVGTVLPFALAAGIAYALYLGGRKIFMKS